jgi:hypothetical protein
MLNVAVPEVAIYFFFATFFLRFKDWTLFGAPAG